MRNIVFLKNEHFPKCRFSEKLVLCRSTCLENVALFRYFYPKQGKTAVPKSNCHKELLILKNWLLRKIFVLKKKLFWKNNCCNKVTVLKKGEKSSCSEKISAPKMYLLCRSSHSEKLWKSSLSKNKVVLKKSQGMRDEKSLFGKKTNKLD